MSFVNPCPREIDFVKFQFSVLLKRVDGSQLFPALQEQQYNGVRSDDAGGLNP